jgi:hypothetical protein
MSDEINDGGPAFPSHGTMGEVTHEGMSLRDYFAAQVIGHLTVTSGNLHSTDASNAYVIADAMLAARKVTP